MTKSEQKKLRKIAVLLKRRTCPASSVGYIHYLINDRVEVADALVRANENGKVAKINSGMDCDHASWYIVQHISTPTVVSAWHIAEDQARWADGPCGIYYDKPSQTPESNTGRDHLAEAFENGHPHVVYV